MNQGLRATPAPMVRLGRYQLLLELGQGGMARVYLGSASGLGGFNKLVVLKVMRDELRDSEGSLAMFLAEARLAARMNHPNVVQTLEVGEDAGRYFICMEYLEGQPLGRLMKKTADVPLPLGARLQLICQVLEGLIYMHGFCDLDGTPLQLVHRDLSPNNIFVTFDGAAKVLDFGVAKAAGISHATEAGTFKGKIGYAAPEQMLGNSEQTSDVFAVGVLLWELLAYRRLSQDRTQQEVLQARMSGIDAELMRSAREVPRDLLRICLCATAKDAKDRYASALEMRDALREYIKAHELECTVEELRELIGALFATERVEIRRLIDQRLKQANLENEQTGQWQIPVAPAILAGAGGVALPASTFPGGAAPRAKPWRFKALIGLGLPALLVALWLGRANRTETLNPLPTASSPAAESVGRVSSIPSGARVVLKVSASPADVEILLDGAKLQGNPFVGEFPKDPALRRLELRSPGRRTEARMIRLDQDLDLLISLPVEDSAKHRALPRAPKLNAPQKIPASALPAPAASPTGALLNHANRPTNARPLDDADPYAK